VTAAESAYAPITPQPLEVSTSDFTRSEAMVAPNLVGPLAPPEPAALDDVTSALIAATSPRDVATDSAGASPVVTHSVIGRNIAVLLSSQVVTWSLALILTIVVPRYLGPSGVGQLRLGVAIWAIATVFGELGTTMVVTLEFARDPASGFAMLGPVVRLRVLGGLLGMFGVLAFVVIAGYDLETCIIVGIVGLGLIALMFADVARAGLFGFQWMSVTARTDVITKVVTVAVVVGVLLAGGGTAAVAGAMGVPAVLCVVLLFRALYSRRDRSVPAVPRPPAASVLQKSSPFFYSSLITAAYSSLDVVIISLVATQEEIGWYAVAATLMGTLLFLPNAIVTSLFPALAKAHDESSNAASDLMGRALRTALIVAVPISFGTIVIADPLVTMLFGQDFAPAGPVLATGGIVLLLMFLTILVGGVARATGKVTVFNVAVTIATVLTIPLDLVFVPWTRDRFGNGAIGGALSFLVTELLILVVLVWKVTPALVERRTVVRTVKCLIAGSAIIVAAWPLRTQFIAIPVIAGSIAYGVMVFVLRIPDEDERQLAHRMWSRFRSLGPARRRPSSFANEANP
jgi:O-antigen/teichoic acid export membrane protein